MADWCHPDCNDRLADLARRVTHCDVVAYKASSLPRCRIRVGRILLTTLMLAMPIADSISGIMHAHMTVPTAGQRHGEVERDAEPRQVG